MQVQDKPKIEFDFPSRIKAVQKLMDKKNIDVLFLTNLSNIYWLTGTAQYGNLIVFPDKDPALFIRRNFFRAKSETNLKNLFELKSTKILVEYLSKEVELNDKTNIATEFTTLPVSYYNYFNKLLNFRIITDIGEDMRNLRMIKDSNEISIHREAAKIAQKTQEIIPNFLKPGVSENEIAGEMVRIAKRNGAEHFSVYNSWFAQNWFIVASGENQWIPSSFPILAGRGNSAAIPFGMSDKKLKSGDTLVADYAMCYKGYHSDHARTYLVDQVPKDFKERAEHLFEAYRLGISELRPRKRVSEVFDAMKNYLVSKGLGKYFEGDGYYYQGLGHGIGLELDEPPFFLSNNDTTLHENMVISLEPKIIIPNWGAVNFEDNFVIKNGPPEILTKTPYIFDFNF